MLGIWVTTLAAIAAPLWPDLSEAPSSGDGTADAAVIVAIEDYAIVGDIPGARQNGLDWYTYLTEGRGIPASRVRLLVDNEGVKESIEDALLASRDAVQPDGTLWVIFIGHGAPGRDGQDGLLVGWDTQQTASSVYARGLSQGGILETLSGGTQANTVAVFDACFSGQDSASGAALVTGLQPMIPSYSIQSRQALVLSAGKSDEFAGPLPGLERPAFSYLVLGAMRGWADEDGDGTVTAQETIDYSAAVLSSVPLGRNQTPQLAGATPEQVLSTASESGPSLPAIRRAMVQPAAVQAEAEDPHAAQLRAEQQRIQREAAMAWVQTSALAQQGGDTGRLALSTFIEQYGAITVSAGSASVLVSIPAVEQAKQWLSRYDAMAAVAQPAAPPSPAPEPVAAQDPAPVQPQGLRAALRSDGYYKCYTVSDNGLVGQHSSIVVGADRDNALFFFPFNETGLSRKYDSLRARADAGSGTPFEEVSGELWLTSAGTARIQFVSLAPEEATLDWEWLGINKIGGVSTQRIVCPFVAR